MVIAASAVLACCIEATASAAIERVRWLQAEIGVRRRLRDTGMPREMLAGVAAKVMTERGLYVNPRAVTDAAQVEAVLAAAW